MSPLISVILPTRDRAARLPAAIESVRSQSLQDLELIIVDDASTDETPDLITAAVEADTRISTLRIQASHGVAAARNAAIGIATGEYLAFIDDDDRWWPRKLEAQLEALRSDPELAAVTCHFESYDERTRRRAAFRGATTYSSRALLWSNFAASVMGIVRRSAFESDLLFDETLTTCEDWDYWLRAAEEGGVATVPEILCRITYHGRGQSAFDIPRRVDGRVRFVAKHGHKMSDACRAYHDARLELLRAPRESERLRIHFRFLHILPRRVRRMVALEALGARFGGLIGDPALGARTLLRLVEADP